MRAPLPRGSRLALTFAGACILSLLAQRPAGAVTISDGNSSLTVNPTSATGAMNTSWTVDGVDELGGNGFEGFWFSVNGSAPAPLSSLSYTPGATIPGTFFGTYTDPGELSVSINDTLAGGSSGSGTAALVEELTFNNISQAPMNLTVYQVDNFHVNGNSTNNSLQLTPVVSPNTADQTQAGTDVNVAVSTTPDNYQTGQGAAIQNELNGSATFVTLSNNSTGPVLGNPTFALQWDDSLDSIGSFQLSVTESVTGGAEVIPAPSAMLMTLTTLGALAGWGLLGKFRRVIA